MIETEDNKGNKKEFDEYKILAKNSFYSFVNSYSGFFFTLITSTIMARIVSDVEWQYLIIALSYITLVSLILTFLPPSLGLSFNYYIPRFRASKENNKLKSFVNYALIIRLLCVLPLFVISLSIFNAFGNIFEINLHNYVHLLYILSPLIIINGFDKIFHDVVRGLNMFRIVFILLVIRYLVHIGGLLILFLNKNIVSLELIALIILLSNLIPFIINFFIILKIQLSLKKSEEEPLTFFTVFKYLLKYGIHLSIRTYLSKFNREFRPQLVSIFETQGTVTGYNIANHYSDVTYEAMGSFNRPLTISFSSLDASNKNEQIEKIYRNLFQYTVLFVLLITGILFFFTDIYVVIIYTASRLEYSTIIKLFIIAMIFNVQSSFFYSLLRASEKVKFIVPITLVSISIKISAFILGLVFFGIIGGMIGINIGNLIEFCIISFLNFKIFKIKIRIKQTVLLYLLFFITLGLSLILENLILADINFSILHALNLLFFRHFQFLSLIVFIITFLVLTVLLKAFTRSDANNLEEIFSRDNFIDKLIRKGLRFLKKILRD